MHEGVGKHDSHAQSEPSSLLGATILGVSTAGFPKDQSSLSTALGLGREVTFTFTGFLQECGPMSAGPTVHLCSGPEGGQSGFTSWNVGGSNIMGNFCWSS